MKGRESLRARKSESRRTRQRQRGRGGSEFVRKGDGVQRRKEMERGWRGETKEMGSVGGCSLAK